MEGWGGMLWKEGMEGGDMTVGECKVAEVMELVELHQVLMDFSFIVKFYQIVVCHLF